MTLEGDIIGFGIRWWISRMNLMRDMTIEIPLQLSV